MRWLVCGGRSFANFEKGRRSLDEHCSSASVVIHGCAGKRDPLTGRVIAGADLMADQWARERGIAVDPFPAQWTRFKGNAGPMRNQQMIDEGRPDRVLALPGGHGTADMVRRARIAGIVVVEIE